MRNNHARASVGPLIGGAAIGAAITGAFFAGHVFYPGGTAQSGGTTTQTLVSTPGSILGGGAALGENTIADIAQRANTAVVNIDTKQSVTVADSPLFGGLPFNDFNMFFGGGNPFQQMPRKFERKGTGSGVIYKDDGYILTNNHVIGGAQSIKVTLADKRVFDGKVVGRDKFTDLAVIKINATGLPAAKFGSSKSLRPGDWAIAIGSPLGYDHSVTLGIVSALNRSLADLQNNVQLIQTDAAINPGNSGGPLLNIRGEVIGLNTAIRANAQNIGFAIPVDLAKDVAQQLVEHGNIERAYVGIWMQDLDPKLARSLGIPNDTRGVLVARTASGGPADRAGLQQGDVIERVDKVPVKTSADVQTLVLKHKPGQTIDFLVLRNGTLTPLEVKVGNMPDSDSNNNNNDNETE